MNEWWEEQDQDERWVQQQLEDEERQWKEEIEKHLEQAFQKIVRRDDGQ